PKGGSLPDLKKLLLARHRSHHGLSRVEEQITKFKNRDWSKDGGAELGGRILQILESIKVIEIIERRSTRRVQLSEEFTLRPDQLAEDAEARLLADPEYKPMLVPPRRWTGMQGGGFLTTQNPELTSLVK